MSGKLLLVFVLATFALSTETDLGRVRRKVCLTAGFVTGRPGYSRCLANVKQFGDSYCLIVVLNVEHELE
jgi:hypothetical protein